jgi:light-regulated signal transduction histidine kinase (bacteriophytochrome)
MSASRQSPAAEPTAPVSEEGANQQLWNSADELRAAISRERNAHNEQLRQFAYAVSHDLREPLRMVASYTQLLNRRYSEHFDADAQEFMRYILESVQRMDKLLADLLAYSRQFQSGGQPLTNVDADAALEGALLNLDKRIRDCNARITRDQLPSVLFDFAQLSEVFRQLIANAITFCGPTPPEVHISSTEDDDSIVFSVRDNGLGIDPRYHEQIFGVFKRLHGREYPGTGMGLAICERIVAQRGGRIWVESDVGSGATLRFSVPK